MPRNNLENEKEIADLIQFLGDITVKATANHESELSKDGIDKLSDIIFEFLKLKEKNQLRYVVERETFLLQNQSKNMYVRYVFNEFDRIFVESLKNHDNITSRHLILTLSKILDRTLLGKNNWKILEELIETRNVLGTLYSRFLTQSLILGTGLESNLLTQHLANVPQFAIFGKEYHPAYVSGFINYHIYRMAKIIIDHDNFQAFKDFVGQFFNSLSFKEPEELADSITSSLYMVHVIVTVPELKKMSDELIFMIKNDCQKNFDKIPEISEVLLALKLKILEDCKKQDWSTEGIEERFSRMNEKLMEFYYSSLLYGTFFKIGAYLMSKGESHTGYLEELWYYGHGKTNETRILNHTPVSESIKWLTLYVNYGGIGSSLYDDFYTFEEFPDANTFHYQYYAFMMIKLGKCYSFDFSRIEKLKNEKNKIQFDFFYELASSLKIEQISEAFDKISKNKQFLSIIRKIDVQENIDNIKNALPKLKDEQRKVIELLVKHGQLDYVKIKKIKEQFTKKYFSDSITDKIATIHYKTGDEKEYLTHKTAATIRREFFIQQNISSNFLIDPVISGPAHFEMKKILDEIQSKIEPVQQDSKDFEGQISSAVSYLKSKNKNPNVIFLPLDVEMELVKKGIMKFGRGQILKIDDIELITISSWKKFDFKDIIIFDSNGLHITYNSDNKDGRISITESHIDEGEPLVWFTEKISLKIAITDPASFRRIINQYVLEL